MSTASGVSTVSTIRPHPDGGVVVRKRIYLDDLDGFGMVHHAQYAVLLDRAVLDYWVEAGWRLDPERAVQAIRQFALTFHAPIRGVRDVDIHVWVSRAGRTSVTHSFEFRSDDGAVLFAEGSRVVVNLDPVCLAPTPFDEETWALAAPLLGQGVARA